MSFLRRRPRQTPDEQAAAKQTRRRSQSSTGPLAWVPEGVRPEPGQRSPRSDWLPQGVERRPPSRPRNRIPAELLQPKPEEPAPAAAAPATGAAPDASGARARDDLQDRLEALEERIMAAQETAAHGGETARAEQTYGELEQALAEMRARAEGQSGRQQATIAMLQARLAGLEEQLQKAAGPQLPARAGRLATTARVAVLVLVFVVIAGAPLFTTRRSVCQTDGRTQTRWTFVAPFDNGGPPRCENELGGTVVLDAIGLK